MRHGSNSGLQHAGSSAKTAKTKVAKRSGQHNATKAKTLLTRAGRSKSSVKSSDRPEPTGGQGNRELQGTFHFSLVEEQATRRRHNQNAGSYLTLVTLL